MQETKLFVENSCHKISMLYVISDTVDGMNVKLCQVHIENLRSIRVADVALSDSSVMFGMNNNGKSNFLMALKLAFGNEEITDDDVFRSSENPKDAKVLIDLKFIPIDNNGERCEQFEENWHLCLGEHIMSEEDGNFFAFRTEFSLDAEKEEYVRKRYIIKKWEGSDTTTGVRLPYGILSVFEFVYIDAQRDILSDIRDKRSLWNKQISKIKFPKESQKEMEILFLSLNKQIISASDFLQQASLDLKDTIKSEDVDISPIIRNVTELHKGLNVYISNGQTIFPISNFGLGTRNQAVFSTAKTIVNKKLSDATERPYYCMIAFEEPESHLHPHLQRQLMRQLAQIGGQHIITTHSPYVLSSSKVNNMISVALHNGETSFYPLAALKLDSEELRKIERTVLNTRGDILFANIVVLAEGETEEQALPIFFKEFFDGESHSLGVSFVGVGGANYLPFLKMLDCIGISWFIFSDGEEIPVDRLKSTIKDLRGLKEKPDLSGYDNIVVLGHSENFEAHLVEQAGPDKIISVIDEYEKELGNVEGSYFNHFLETHHGMKGRKGTIRDYKSDGGKIRAVLDCMKNGKTKYVTQISKSICSMEDAKYKFPEKIEKLLEKIKSNLEG